MKTKAKTHTNYVDALENEHLYAVLTKRDRTQILIQPTAKQLTRARVESNGEIQLSVKADNQ
jgi:hypothetical protein